MVRTAHAAAGVATRHLLSLSLVQQRLACSVVVRMSDERDTNSWSRGEIVCTENTREELVFSLNRVDVVSGKLNNNGRGAEPAAGGGGGGGFAIIGEARDGRGQQAGQHS
ncbi:hypothetical protein L7F22_044422 [Adiantum nelumboides]|nr:hypothetical protein [Adiantum nelumboides]